MSIFDLIFLLFVSKEIGHFSFRDNTVVFTLIKKNI